MPAYTGEILFNDQQIILDPAKLLNEFSELGLDPYKFENRANSFRLPRGSLPGRGYFLMMRRDFVGLSLTGHTHKVRFRCAPDDVTIENLIIVSAESLLGGPVEQPTDVYLVEVADARLVASLSGINRNYNVSTPDWQTQFAESLNAGSEWTHTTFTDNLYSALPSVFTGKDTGSMSLPATAPKNFALHGVSPWEALCKVFEDSNNIYWCSKTGQLVVKSGSFSDTANLSKIANSVDYIAHHSHFQRNTTTFIPEKVCIAFPRRDHAFQTSSDPFEVTFNAYWRNRPIYEIEVATSSVLSGVTTITGTKAYLHHSLVAYYDDQGALQNGSELSTEATAHATRYLQSLVADGLAHQIYNGAFDFTPGPRIACVTWYDTGDGIKTEIQLYPRNQHQAKLDAVSLQRNGWFTEPVKEYPGPPDLARDKYPYEHWAIAKITESQGIAPYGQGSAYVKYWDDSTATNWKDTSKPIVVTDILGLRYNEGDTVIVMYHGQARQWIICNPTTMQSEFVRFQLTTELSFGSATAQIIVWNGAAYVQAGEITVTDFTGSSWAANKNAYGWAIYRADSSRWEIIWVQQQARFVTFFLTSDVSGGEADATILDWWHITMPPAEITVVDRLGIYEDNPADASGFAIYDATFDEYIIVTVEDYAEGIHFELYDNWSAAGMLAVVKDYWRGLDPGNGEGQVTVVDYARLFERAVKGAKGYATFDKALQQYVVTNCQQVGFTATAILASDLNGEDDATISGFVITSPTPFDQEPENKPTTAKNPFKHFGKADKEVQLSFNDSTGEWEIVDVEKTAMKVIVKYDGNGYMRLEESSLQGYTVEIAVEYGTDPAWEDLVQTTNCG